MYISLLGVNRPVLIKKGYSVHFGHTIKIVAEYLEGSWHRCEKLPHKSTMAKVHQCLGKVLSEEEAAIILMEAAS